MSGPTKIYRMQICERRGDESSNRFKSLFDKNKDNKRDDDHFLFIEERCHLNRKIFQSLLIIIRIIAIASPHYSYLIVFL